MVSKRSTASKSARATDAKGKAVRAKPRPPKLAGNPRSRRAVKEASKRVLAYCAHLPTTAGSKILGVAVHDLQNMRTGYQLTLPILLKMVRVRRFDPRSILEGPSLRKLAPTRKTRGAQLRLVNARIREFVWSIGGLELARRSGMSSVGVYGLRYGKLSTVKLVTLISFCAVGPSLEAIIYGD
jgi:hypothetical protein